ncbi:carboxypeptidase-like regulatory domain-containing protein [Caulobacter sp. UC70_42]|uniref:carboxypeptidase-like regulatory domain-containing protein n=1 Tax=Caulobacter sp. UC70_42 TaxID=3374551 RepID=UPI003757E789
MGCRTYWSGAAFGVMMLAAASAAHGQESSSNIHGVVTLNGAPVANAGVAVVHTPSGTRAFTSTEASGVFDLRGLRVGGPYTITVTGGGQPPKTLENVFLRVTKTEEVSIDLAAEETVRGRGRHGLGDAKLRPGAQDGLGARGHRRGGQRCSRPA